MAKTGKRLYLIPVLSKTLDILELLEAESQPLSLEEVHRRTGVSKTTVYRVLKTLVHRGYLAQTSEGTYRHVARAKKLCFGFAGQGEEMPFSNEVQKSLAEAARRAGVDLFVLDNNYDGTTAVRNAELFVERRVDLVLELQVEQEVAPIIGDKIAAANIPLIAIDIPHPNATYFGVDNYRVGVEAGVLLVEHARSAWAGRVDAVLGLDLPEAGILVQGRVSGAFEAVRAAFPALPAQSFVRLDGRGLREHSREAVSGFLQRHPERQAILIAAATDSSALGAVEAVCAVQRERHVAIVGQDCIAEATAEMKRRDSPLIGSISHEIASYGPALIHLGLALLRGQTVPPYNYVSHRVVTRRSLLES